MNLEEIKKLEEEKKNLLEKINAFEMEKNKVLLRIIEIQGILKYLKEKE